MTREVEVNSTDQTIAFWAFDSSGSGVAGITAASPGLAISARVSRNGRIVSTTAITGSLTTRDVPGTHKDFALTEVGNGQYELDLPDSYVASVGDTVSLVVSATSITGTVAVGTILVTPVVTGSSGTGARSVTVTVDDGTNPVENATVRITEGVNTYTGTTNASGVYAFGSMQDATYTVNISKPGYTFATTTLVVDDDKTPTYSMTANAFTAPSTPAQATGLLNTYDEQGQLESDVSITIQIESGPGTAGSSYDAKLWTKTSVAGVVEFPDLFRGATYKIWRGVSKDLLGSFTVPASGDDSFNIDEVIGKEAA